ncbi:dipeptide transport system permease protein dppC [Vibrio sp. JCM 19236]|nr:dipeptide transport system permease protein dppC [Vibrio sp. JCM 19236]
MDIIQNTSNSERSPLSQTLSLWGYRFKNNPLLYIGLLLLITMVLAALFAPWIAPNDPAKMNFAHKLQSPNSEFWFGTDNLGRDIFSRVLYGAQTSLVIGVVTVIFALLIGLPVGLIAGYCGGVSIIF